MIITSVEKAREKNMMRIFIDNHYAFSIPYEDFIRNNLYELQEINDEQLNHIRRNVLVNAARQQAIRYLTIKDRTENELIKKMIDSGFDADVSKSAAEELHVIGYVNDARYAMKYLAERIRNKALSKKALRFELEQKGVSTDIIEHSLAEFETNDEEVALRAARKKFGKYDISDQKVQQKVINFLLHRGFSYEIGKRVINSMKEDFRV